MPRRNRRERRRQTATVAATPRARRKTSTDPDYLARQLVRRGLASTLVLDPSPRPFTLIKEISA
jgi:hypothetical protein